MPYSANQELPAAVRHALTDDAQSRYRSVVNSALERGLDDSKAHASAWSVVGNGWQKPKGAGKWTRIQKAEARTLFVSRPLENGNEVIAWAKSQGFETTLPANDFHITIVYSKTPLQWPSPYEDVVTVRDASNRTVERLGNQGAVVLRFTSSTLEARCEELKALGAKSDFPSFKPHITISWKSGPADLSKVQPYAGPLVFGPEDFKPIDPNWSPDSIMEKAGARHNSVDRTSIQAVHDHAVSLGATCNGEEAGEGDGGADDTTKFTKFFEFAKADVIKVDDELGLVFGWAIVSKIDGQDYFDVQGDNIPEPALLKAATDYMLSPRIAKEMHFGDEKGTIVFAFPLTTDIAKAMAVETAKSGLMIAMKPHNAAMLDKFRSGELTGFSIGGTRMKDEPLA